MAGTRSPHGIEKAHPQQTRAQQTDVEPSLEETEQKIERYRLFIQDRLQPDLKKTLDVRDKIYTKIAQYLDLEQNIETILATKSKKLKTMVDLGANFYAEAVVDDVSKIIVEVGLNFLVEFTLDEAVKFIKVKKDNLTK